MGLKNDGPTVRTRSELLFFLFISTEMSLCKASWTGKTPVWVVLKCQTWWHMRKQRSNRGVLLTCQAQGWEERENHVNPLFHSCRKAVWGLIQPTLHSLLSPLKWERFPTWLDWLDLPVEHSPVPGGFFPDVTSWTGRRMRVCLGPKFVSWAKVNKPVCSDSFHKAQRALRKSVRSQPAQMRASCSPSTSPTATPASNMCAMSEGGAAARVPQWRCTKSCWKKHITGFHCSGFPWSAAQNIKEHQFPSFNRR